MENRYTQILPAPNRAGGQTLVFNNRPAVASMAAIAGEMEGQGTFGDHFDTVLTDDLWGEETWEKAESKMFEEVVRKALSKENLAETWVECLVGGDLEPDHRRELRGPAARASFLGLYGACSTMAESLLVGSVLVSGVYVLRGLRGHQPFLHRGAPVQDALEMGTQRTPTAQRTVTGAGCTILVGQGSGAAKGSKSPTEPSARSSTSGVTDVNNMGAAMAPALAGIRSAPIWPIPAERWTITT